MGSEPVGVQRSIRFGEGYELDLRLRRLCRDGRPLKVERIPLEILVLLLEHRDEIVTRDEIVSKVWGTGVFLDTDNSIRGAIRKLRQALKDDAETPRFIQTITGQGYRFIAPVIAPEDQNLAPTARPAGLTTATPIYGLATEAEASLPPSSPSLEEQRLQPKPERQAAAESDPGSRSLGMHRGLVAGGVALLALLAIGYVATRYRRVDAPAPQKIRSLAVLPLKNLSGDSSQEYLADGMTEALIGRLSGIRDLRVISRTSVMQFKDSNQALPDIAKMLHVDAVVEGSVIREGNHIRVHAQLIRAATEDHFWSEEYEREFRDVLALEKEVAQSIAAKVEVTVTGEERQRLAAARSVPPQVYENYLQGQFALDKSNSRAEIDESIRYFQEAINTDATFAPAYVGLARAYDRLATVFIGVPPWQMRPRVIQAAQKALALDPTIAEAYVLMAGVHQQQWHWADAEAGYRQALELNPNDAAAHRGLARWLMFQGRLDEALGWARRARELDPLANSATMAWILMCARRYQEAKHELESELAVRPDDGVTLWVLGFVLIEDGRPEDAIPVLERAMSVSHESAGITGTLVAAYAYSGRRKDALRSLAGLQARQQKSYIPAAAFIPAYIGLHDYDQAFVWFERAYQEQSNILQFLKVHPLFDPVRDDPRFRDLLKRVGLEEAK